MSLGARGALDLVVWGGRFRSGGSGGAAVQSEGTHTITHKSGRRAGGLGRDGCSLGGCSRGTFETDQDRAAAQMESNMR